MTETVKKLTDEEFYKKYHTVENHIRPNDNNEFETYGDEVEYVHRIAQETPGKVWTLIDNNDGWYGIAAGCHCPSIQLFL